MTTRTFATWYVTALAAAGLAPASVLWQWPTWADQVADCGTWAALLILLTIGTITEHDQQAEQGRRDD